MADWSSTQYLKFEDERTRPAIDLLGRVAIDSPARVIDLGCGPGNSTELLIERWPQASVTGQDLSPDMLAAAEKRLPAVRFELGDACNWTAAQPVDVIFANALFQWVPDHILVLQRVMGELRPGGVLAVQMPDNLGEPSHVLMRETASASPFAGKLRNAARDPLPPIASYYDALSSRSARLEIWRTTYVHALADAHAIVEWVKGTGLRPYLDPLEPAERGAFLADYEQRIAAAYPTRADGKVLLPFPRLFLVATRH